MSRREQLALEARILRDSGLLQRQIAVVLGVSRRYAAELLDDPNGAKVRARKRRYGGSCRNCGSRTDGSNGRDGAPVMCHSCRQKQQHDDRFWTPERIIQAIQEWNREHGRPPIAPEWVTPGARVGQIAPVSTVQREFGSWRAAIQAAGFDGLGPGKYERTPEWRARLGERSRGPKPERRGVDWTLVVRLRAEGIPYHEIARQAKCSANHAKWIVGREAPHLIRRRHPIDLPGAA